MQTITTKLIPTTNKRPRQRIKAETTSGISYTCNIDNFDSIESAHQGAAHALMLQLEWKGVMVSGDTKQGKIWVFLLNVIANDVISN